MTTTTNWLIRPARADDNEPTFVTPFPFDATTAPHAPRIDGGRIRLRVTKRNARAWGDRTATLLTDLDTGEVYETVPAPHANNNNCTCSGVTVRLAGPYLQQRYGVQPGRGKIAVATGCVECARPFGPELTPAKGGSGRCWSCYRRALRRPR